MWLDIVPPFGISRSFANAETRNSAEIPAPGVYFVALVFTKCLEALGTRAVLGPD